MVHSGGMVAVGLCGEWLVFCCGTKLCAVHTQESRDVFVFDCSAAEKKPADRKEDNSSDGVALEETGSDSILAFAASRSGKLLALTDDAKRLILFRCEPVWRHVSTRWVVRRCTSLVFSQAEDQLLVADKSGDVYSFSVAEPQREGDLKMGHLSMLLAVTLSPDDQFIITADRDEKIRVSHLRSPHNIQSFCLGHTQFVSSLQIPHGHPSWLLSGSGDGTLRLWEYESGQSLQSWDLGQLGETAQSEAAEHENPTVCRISSSPDGHHVAVQCEGSSTLHFFTLHQDDAEKLRPHSTLALPHRLLDVSFDPVGRLWVLTDSSETPLQSYTLTPSSSWQCDADDAELIRVTEALRPHWDTLDASTRTSRRFEHLHKVTFDNVTVYLQKKQQRLEEQQLKRSKPQKTDGNKRAKTDRPKTVLQTL
ncbi:tRNA (guanine-N(7)-)-methyltransferase non-catalytic subunit wdr4 isoform 1-T1 [Pholidichthys leucotaenia]